MRNGVIITLTMPDCAAVAPGYREMAAFVRRTRAGGLVALKQLQALVAFAVVHQERLDALEITDQDAAQLFE